MNAADTKRKKERRNLFIGLEKRRRITTALLIGPDLMGPYLSDGKDR